MRYMDDGRAALYRFKAGWRWTMGRIKYCKRWEQEDMGLSGLEISKRILAGTMGGLEDYLTFTMETEEDFENGWLPTLDAELKVNLRNIIEYRFFEKPTNPNTVLHSRTAMAEDSKVRSLTNELIRRMLTTSRSTTKEARNKILDDMAQKMANSGYGMRQIRRVLLSGIKGYEKMVRLDKKGVRKTHRTAKESNKTRASKKLTEKSEWFRKQKNDNQDLDNEEKDESCLNKYLRDGKNQEDGNQNMTIPTRTVLFVENTRGGELAKRLRSVEKRTQNMTGFKTKIVEGVGSKLKNLLPT